MAPWLESLAGGIVSDVFSALITSPFFWECLFVIFAFEILWGSMQRAVYRRIT